MTSPRSNFARAALLSLSLTACATSPEKLGAADVSPLAYQGYDCQQIAMESDRISRRVNTLHSELKKEASADAWQTGVGIVLFWPALFFLEGGDGPQAAEYRQLKGEYEALQTVSVQKKCGLEFRSLEAQAKEAGAGQSPASSNPR